MTRVEQLDLLVEGLTGLVAKLESSRRWPMAVLGKADPAGVEVECHACQERLERLWSSKHERLGIERRVANAERYFWNGEMDAALAEVRMGLSVARTLRAAN